MTAAAELLAEARAAGLRLRRSGGELRLRPTAAPPDPALLACLRERKAELLELLLIEAWRAGTVKLPAGLRWQAGTGSRVG